MHKIIDFITYSSQQIQLVLFVGIFFLCWNIENIVGLTLGYKKWRHAFLNMPFIFTNIPGQLILGVAFVKVIQWTGAHHFGLNYVLPGLDNNLLLFIVSFLLLDFGEYIYHIIMHKVKRLWMFHIVHHSDSVVDVSTTLREHPGENIIRLSFTLLWVFLSGALFWVLILRQIIQIIATFFAHMNYQLPQKADKIIGLIFITPNLHHIHHHYKQPYTDTNYGDVLSIWDRMFGTFQRVSAKNLIFGVDTFMEQKDIGKFSSIFKIPFGKYRKSLGK